jgi:hypothetical protein
VRKTSALDGEASVASEDFVSADSHKGSVFGANAAAGLDLRVAMQVGLRKRHCIAGRFCTLIDKPYG